MTIRVLLDASTGMLLWKIKVDEHPTARITGGVRYFEGRVFVPVASGEEGAGGGGELLTAPA